METTYENALTACAARGDVEGLNAELARGAKIDKMEREGFGETALMAAVGMNRAACARELIAAGAKLEARDGSGWTALSYACRNGHEECARLLIESGSDVNAKHMDGGTPLLLAAMNGQTDCVRELVRAGVDVESTGNDGGFALAEAAGCEISSCVEVLVAAGCNLDRRIVETGVALEGGTSLMLCARYGLDAAVAALITAGADIEAKSNNGRTALMEAARWSRDSYDCARMLLDGGADPMAMDRAGATAEDLARMNPDSNAAELMVGLLNVFKERNALGICVRQASSSVAKRM